MNFLLAANIPWIQTASSRPPIANSFAAMVSPVINQSETVKQRMFIGKDKVLRRMRRASFPLDLSASTSSI